MKDTSLEFRSYDVRELRAAAEASTPRVYNFGTKRLEELAAGSGTFRVVGPGERMERHVGEECVTYAPTLTQQYLASRQ